MIKNIVDDEYDYLKNIMLKNSITPDYVVDIGGGIYEEQNNIINFYTKENSNGLIIEADFEQSKKIKQITQNKNVEIVNKLITPININDILRKSPKNIDIIKIDIDSYDLDVIKSILENDFSFKIIQMELQFEIPPPLKFNTKYFPDWKRIHKGLYGSSLYSQYEILSAYNYELYDIIKVNGNKSIMHDAIYFNPKYIHTINNISLAEKYEIVHHNINNAPNLGKFGANFHNLLYEKIKNNKYDEAVQEIKNIGNNIVKTTPPHKQYAVENYLKFFEISYA